jgi:hypothetical protein
LRLSVRHRREALPDIEENLGVVSCDAVDLSLNAKRLRHPLPKAGVDPQVAAELL